MYLKMRLAIILYSPIADFFPKRQKNDKLFAGNFSRKLDVKCCVKSSVFRVTAGIILYVSIAGFLAKRAKK